MSEAVPTIYAPPTRPVRLSLYERLIALVIAGGCAGVIATAIHLRPSPDGTGTHQGLGFLSCTMLQTTGIPCPSCGMTTSFAWFYRGSLVASFWVQPAGFVLAWLTGVLLAYSLYEAVTARPIHRLLRFVPMRVWVIAGVAVLAFGWGWKIMIHLWGIDGWKSPMGG
jgi:hypothetical protein